MAASSTNNLEEVKFNTSKKFIDNLIKNVSEDCHFEFLDAFTKEIKEIKAHSRLLSILSPVFAIMFNEQLHHNSNEFVIEDATADDFGTFLDYFYKGTIKLGNHNIEAVFYLAHKYDVDDLLSSCMEFAIKRLTAENVIDYYDLATRFEQEHLKVKCNTFITTNTASVLSSAAFMLCDRSTLVEILKIQEMSCKEHIVFDACINWAKFQCQEKDIDDSRPKNLRAELNECFGLIRFKEMERDEFRIRYELLKVMLTKQEVDEIFMHFMDVSTRTNGIRYKSGELKIETKMPPIFLYFNRTNVQTTLQCSSFQFTITKTAMLTEIGFAQPFVLTSIGYRKLVTNIFVYRGSVGGLGRRENGMHLASVEVTGEDILHLNIQRPILIEMGEVYTIEVEVSGIQKGILIRRSLFHYQPKAMEFDLYPMVGMTSVISALFFEIAYRQT